MDEKRVAEYFLVVGRPEDSPVALDELANESVLKATYKLDPIVDIAIINRSFGESAPAKFKCIEFTPSGFPADLNHGSIRAPEMYLCYRRGRDKPPLVDIGVLYDGKDTKERVLAGCEVLYNTVQGRSANVNNSGSTRIYITYRRASPTAACDTLAVTEICVILLNKGETAPHAYHTINKTLNKGMMGSDVYLCYKKSMTKTNVLAYRPVVLSRYPTEDFPGLPLPERVAMFCLPLGATLECWPADIQQPLPVFSTFILTAASGDKLYGAAVTFYESQVSDRLDEVQLRQLNLPDGSTNAAEAEAVAMTIHQNKCICLLSCLPFFETFKKFLGFLYRMSRTGGHRLPLERYIAHFLNEVPFPSPQRPRILIQLPTTAITLSQPDETPLPKSGASFIELLKNLGPTHCITILLFTLMEQKLLIHSLRPAVLTSVAEAVANIIFPFHWQCPYIPLCPLALSYVLNSPTPFIVGIDSRYFDLYDPPSDVTCIDLDTNSLTISDDRKGQTLKMMPKKAVKVLKATLEKLYENLCQNPTFSGASNQEWLDTEDGQSETDFSGWKKEMHMETSIQEAFLRFMAVILKGYNNFLLPIIKAPTLVTTDVSNLFDIQGFLKSRDRAYHKFFVALMKTQAFSRFIEERSFVSDKDTCLAFFDECVEKVDENSHDVRLIDLEDSLQSERTVFVPPPEPTGLPDNVEYNYSGFPLLDSSLFPPVSAAVASQSIATLKTTAAGETNLSFLCSPMTRRTKHELKSAQKIAMKHSNIPKMWANCLVWHCYSLWFIHLPAYMKTVHSKTKALRIAFEVLSKAQSERLQPPDEVCYRVMMQLCGLYHQPIMAVKVLSEMKRNGVQPNAVTYGFYNKAVLESKWPTADTRGYQLWTLLRHVVMAVAHFKRLCHTRRHSVYSNSESDLDRQSLDSFLDAEPVGATIIKDLKSKGQGKRSRTDSETGPSQSSTAANEERISNGGLSDRGYGSSNFDEGKRISLALGSQNSLDLSGNRLVTSANDRTPTESDRASTPSMSHGIGAVTKSSGLKGDSGTSSDRVVGTVTSSSSCETVASSPLCTAANANELDVECQDFYAEMTDDYAGCLSADGIDCSVNATLLASDSDGLTQVEEVEGEEKKPDDGSSNQSQASEICALDGSSQTLDSSLDLSSPDGPNTELERSEGAGGGEGLGSNTSLAHNLLIPVTENDPLGVFSCPPDAPTTDANNSQPDDNNDVSRQRSLLSDVRLFGGTGARESQNNSDLNGVILRDGVRRPSSEIEQCHPPDGDNMSDESTVSSRRPKSSSSRGEIIGSVMRTAATRFFSKYNDIKKSISSQGVAKSDSGSLSSINSLGVASEPTTATASLAAASESSDCDRASSDDRDGASVAAGYESVAATPPKSRLRVPGLYAPLATMWGGLKTLPTRETLQGLASSLEHMTASMRGSLLEGWTTSTEAYDGDDGPVSGGRTANGGGLEGEEGGSMQEDFEDERAEFNGLSEMKVTSPHGDLDQLVPVEENSDRGSVTGDQSSIRCSTGSMLSLPQSSAPVEVEMSSLSKCQSCGNLLYDEEIMAGWTSDDSNLNTSCQFCGHGVVPFIHIYIRDYRQSIRSPLSNLSQSVDSMLSVQSAPVSANRKPVADLPANGDNDVLHAPSGDDLSSSSRSRLTPALETMLEASTECEEQTESAGRGSVEQVAMPVVMTTESARVLEDAKSDAASEESSAKGQRTEDDCDDDKRSEKELEMRLDSDSAELKCNIDLEVRTVHENKIEINFGEIDACEINEATTLSVSDEIRDTSNQSSSCIVGQPPSCLGSRSEVQWRSKDLELGLSSYANVRRRLDPRRLENRRCTSEISLDLLTPENAAKSSHSRHTNETTAADAASIRSAGSDEKNGLNCVRKYVELDPITVPYLSPLVLRKEFENVLDQDGDLCLSRSEFLDQHPILYWNLVWYFKRLDVPSHMPGFILTAKSLNKSNTPLSSVWSSGDSRHVSITCMWDNVRLHQDHGAPMYILWNQAQGSHSNSSSEMFSKSTMASILNMIKKNDVISPLRLILKERSKRRMQTSKTRFHSIYRDLLFISFAALGRENIDLEAFDREFKSMFLELPAHDSARLRNADRTPSSTAVWCRKMFHELQLGTSF